MKDSGQLRIQREQEHFDHLAREDTIFEGSSEFDYLSHPCVPENHKLLQLFPSGFQGVRILDLGCGLGEASIAFAKRGARVTGIDVSSISIARAKRLLSKDGASAEFQVVDGYKLPFQEGEFDLVYGNGVLHHLDLEQSLPEIRRVLKPHALGYFIEPAIGNPIIAVYRSLAKKRRSTDERPLSKKEYALITREFPHMEVFHFQLAQLFVFLKIFFIEWEHPSAVSYWRLPIQFPSRYRRFYDWGGQVDRILRKWMPRLFARLCWNHLLILHKDSEHQD